MQPLLLFYYSFFYCVPFDCLNNVIICNSMKNPWQRHYDTCWLFVRIYMKMLASCFVENNSMVFWPKNISVSYGTYVYNVCRRRWYQLWFVLTIHNTGYNRLTQFEVYADKDRQADTDSKKDQIINSKKTTNIMHASKLHLYMSLWTVYMDIHLLHVWHGVNKK